MAHSIYFSRLAKTFNCVNHDILIGEMQRYGIRDISLNFFKSYLTDRYQLTRVNGHDSNRLEITCGVPQGSVLGPLLFILYVNDLSKAPGFTISLFADDTCLILSHDNIKTLEKKL